MSQNGLLIEYEYCTGCHACELACQQEHGYPQGPGGITVAEIVTQTGDKVNVDFMPTPTHVCDLCAERTKKGDVPACVKHCQAFCIYYGTTAELVKKMEGMHRAAVYAPL